MYASKSPVVVALLLAAIGALPVSAAEKKADPGKGEVRRLQQAQRQLAQEKNELMEQKASVEAELGEVRKKADAETRRAAGLNREVTALRSARDEIAARLAETEAELRRTQEGQRAAEAEGKRLQFALTTEKQRHFDCAENGKALRKAGAEVLSLYESKSCLDSTLQREPFTGLKRVDIENAVEDLRDRLENPRPAS